MSNLPYVLISFSVFVKAMGHQRCSRPLWWEERFEEEAVWSRRSKRIQESKQEGSEGSEESKGGLDRCSVRGDWNLPEQKQQQESISAGEGFNLRKTRYVLNYPRKVWELSYWRKRDSQQMDRILLRTVQLPVWELWRQCCIGLQPVPARRCATNPPWGSWDCSSITEKGEVSRSW